MKRIRRNYLIWSSIILCLFAFALPFLLKTYSDSFSSVLILSLTAVGTVATVLTLIIAIFLYDRFGLERKFIDKQTDKIFELSELLMGMNITAKTKEVNYIVRLNCERLTHIKEFPSYKKDSKKSILVSFDDYSISFKGLLEIFGSYWIPPEIKNKMEFLDLVAIDKIENPFDENYVRLNFHSISDNKWVIIIPKMTFGNFINNFYELVKVIDDWLNKHSDFPIKLN